MLNLHDIEPASTKLGKVFAKGKSFERDMAILSIAYTLQKSSELRNLIQLIVVIRDKDSEGQLTKVLETCARFSVQLASATDAQQVEATRALAAFNETVAKLKTIRLNGDGKSLDGLVNMIKEDIKRIKPSFMNDGELGTSERLSKVLDITIGTTISILSLVQEASSLIPVPWVQPLIGKVVSMLQAVSQTRSNYNEMKQVAAIAGEFVVACAVICSESTVGPSERLKRALNKFTKALGSIAGECDNLSRLNLLSRYLRQSAQMDDLQAIRTRLNTAIQLFQTEISVNIKLDIEELNRKIDFASLNGLPSHPRYTHNEYLEKSRDDVIQDVFDWIDNAPESVLWVHGAVGLGKSTIAQELVHLLKSEDRLAGGVFLTNLTTELPDSVIQMISRQLGMMYPRAIANIADAARKLDGPHDKLEDYFSAYLFDPIHALEYPYQLVIVVDGLDEWRNYESFLAELVHIPSPSPLKFVLTSRFNYSIERAVDKMPTRKYALPLASQSVIERYFHHHFSSGDINWRGQKPDDDKIHRLAARANGLLIWAATARKLVTNAFDAFPHEILDRILSSEEKVVNQKDGPEDGKLERLYRGAMSTLFPSDIEVQRLRNFLAATIVLQEALPIGDFARLSGISESATEKIHQRLAALQTQGDPKTNLISPAIQRFHASFIEFITTESIDQIFQAIGTTELEAHYILANRCLEIVKVLSSPGGACTYQELCGVEQYAVKFWPLHFSSGTPHQQLVPSSGTVGVDLSEEAMCHWATLFLPCISARFRDGHSSLDGIQKSVLPYKVAIMIGNEDVATLSYHIQCLEIATQLQPLDFGTWKALGVAYHRLHQQSQSNRDLNKEITAFRHGLEPAPHPNRSESLNNLAHAIHTRFEQQGASNDLDEAIYLHLEALLLRRAPHPDRSTTLDNLACAILSRFRQRGASNDLDDAISLYREAFFLRPAPHPDRSLSLNNLAAALSTRFERRGDSNDVEEAITLYREALLHPGHSIALTNLARSLHIRFKQQGGLNNVDEAISLFREALLLQPASHPLRSESFNNLANALLTRLAQWGTSNDIDEAISLHREALLLRPAPHPDRPMSLNNLATALHTRFDERGDSNDLDDAISMHRQTLLLWPAPHPNRFMPLHNLASALKTRFEWWGTSNDLDDAISLHREALPLRPVPHPDRSQSLDNFATALKARFELWGASNDLDHAISLHQEALLLRPASHPNHPMSLNNLASALRTRFEQRGDSNDLDAAISMLRQALLLWPAPHQNRFMPLNNLATGLHTRFEQRGDSNDLDDAISLHRQALLLRPAYHPRYSDLHKGLVIALQSRFDQGRLLHDITEVVLLYERLVDCPIQDPNRSWALKHLPAALKERHALIGDNQDIVEGTDAD